jgi:HD superfamily phosphohydrolase
VQRLRSIRQTGFSQMAFPGATHTRYVHSLGALHLAGLAFDQAYHGWSFSSPGVKERFRAAARVAALCHDLGHPPFSHCTEFAMPAVGTLPLGWAPPKDPARRATHEDYTVAILEATDLGATIDREFPFTARHVASLVRHDVDPGDDFFHDGGVDHRGLLSQIVSSELDVDRMDYLVRDATCTGARYGQVDTTWLLANLTTWVVDDRVLLALEGRAVYAFDHFLLARHHMFLMVYFHHKSVVYEELLRRHVEGPDGWTLPSDLDAYRASDDVALLTHLRSSPGEWARRISEQRPYRRVLERHGNTRDAQVDDAEALLRGEGIDVISAASTGRLSRYERIGRKRRAAPEIYVLERVVGGTPGRGDDGLRAVERVRTLTAASQVFERYAGERIIARLYVPPEDEERALVLLAGS